MFGKAMEEDSKKQEVVSMDNEYLESAVEIMDKKVLRKVNVKSWEQQQEARAKADFWD